ncbi:MAG: zinc ribbon domain-containing protein [Lachnospiraceae bacterium]|nr:zinc ribbon domain-containing protein [Lachnospiraceae bacterium]
MFCYSCGTSLPDGSRSCPVCGENQPQSNTGYQRPDLNEWRRNEVGRLRTRTAMLVDPLTKIYKYKLILVILSAIVSVVTILATLSIDKLSEDSANGLMVVFVLIGLACIVLEIMLCLAFKHAGQYDAGFETVYKLFLAYIILGVASNLLIAPLDTFADIAKMIVGIAYVYHLYGALADAVRPVSDSTAKKWDGLFKYYIASCVIAFICTIIAVIKAADVVRSFMYGSLVKYVGPIMWVLIFAEFVDLIISVLEVVFLNETATKMERAIANPNGSK